MKQILLLVAISLLWLLLPHKMFAHEGEDHTHQLGNVEVKQKIQVKQEGGQIRVQQRVQVCSSAESKIKTTIVRYNTNGQRQRTHYQQLVTRLKSIIDQLKAKNVDTTQLEATLPELEAKIAAFNDDIDSLVTHLQEVQQYPCDETNGKFQLEVQSSRTQQQEIRNDIKEVKRYYQQVIRPALLKARGEYAATPKNSMQPNPQES